MNAAAEIPPSTHFTHRKGLLHAEEVALTKIAERFGTPCYVYSAGAIDEAFRAVDGALAEVPHLVAYAVKANGNLTILRRLAKAGSGADVVSGGELARALEAGFAPANIIFSGVGKTDVEIGMAIEAGIRSLHVESPQELEVVEGLARARGVRAPIGLRINPDVDPKTHPYIATGLKQSKFGIDFETARALLPRVLQSEHLQLEGIACHIGSMVAPPAIGDAVERIARFATECRQAGAKPRTLDAGGGWAVRYGNEDGPTARPSDFGRAIIDAMKRGGADDLELVIEPGRIMVADAGVLLTRVIFLKEQQGKRFVIVDAAMTELLRPALYRAYHAVVPVTEPKAEAARTPADVVGPVCESGDFIALDRPLPPLARGDLLAVRSAGAYAAAMGSEYNARLRAPEVLVEGEQVREIRRRPTFADLWRDEV